MDAQHPLSSAQRRAESGWQWVPVRLDLHQKLTETPQGEVIVAGSGPESDREHILRMLRQQEVPALYSAKNQQIELMLPVSAPFHCALMEPAAAVMREALAGVQISAPRLPVVVNVRAAAVSDAVSIRDLLVEQVTGEVRWP